MDYSDDNIDDDDNDDGHDLLGFINAVLAKSVRLSSKQLNFHNPKELLRMTSVSKQQTEKGPEKLLK